MRLLYRLPLLTLVLLLALPASAQLEGVGYRLAPAASYVVFDGDAALSDGFLYGGGAGLSFGEFLELNGSYLLGNGFETDYSDLSGVEGDSVRIAALAQLDGREVDIQRYGGEIKLNLGTGSVVPFLSAGTGLIRFDPDGRDATRNIYLLGGGGLQFTAADRYAVSVSVEDMAYRYNPGSTFFNATDLVAAGLAAGDFNQTTVNNLAVRGSVQLYLGGRRPGSLSDVDRELRRQFAGGLGGLSLVVEPFYGRVNFDDAFAYRDQSFVGGEIGFDLGPLVGIRGFYARGTDGSDPTSFEDIQMVGGDLRLRLSDSGSFAPFLSVGGGYLDVLDGYAAEEGATPENALAEDRPFAAGGAGVELFLSPRLRAIGEARALVMSTQDEEDLSQPEDVYVSPLFRAGLSFGLGGDAGSRVAVVRQSELEAERAQFEAEIQAERARLAAEREQFDAELAAAQEAAAEREAELQDQIEQARAEGDARTVARLEDEQARVRTEAMTPNARLGAAPLTVVGREVRTAQGDRVVTIPLPEQGELYVRYGDPGGVQIGDGFGTSAAAPRAAPPQAAATTAAPRLSQDEIREIIRQTLRESLADQNAETLTESDVAAIERRVEDRIADRIGNRLQPAPDASASQIRALERRQDDLIDEIRSLRVELNNRQSQAPIVVQPGAPAVAPTPQPAAPVVTTTPDGETVVLRPRTPTTTAGVTPIDRRAGTFAVSPTAGLGFGSGPDGALIGARVDYETGGTIRYIPELLVGVGSRTTFLANADLAFGVPVDAVADYGAPYLRAGIGLLSYGSVPEEDRVDFDDENNDGKTTLTLNLGLGADLAAGGGRVFVDVTTGNFGRYNRITAGYRFPFGRSAY